MWGVSPIAVAALIVGADMRAVAKLSEAQRDGLVQAWMREAFGSHELNQLLYPQLGEPTTLFTVLSNSEFVTRPFSDPEDAYKSLLGLLPDTWATQLRQLWEKFRPGVKALLSTQLNVNSAGFAEPGFPHSIGDYRPSGLPVVEQGALVLEPLQGPWRDCWLVASMIAAAWCELPQFGEFLDDLPVERKGSRARVHWRDPRDGSETVVDASFPHASNGASIYTVSASGNESWPTLIEKVFAAGMPADASDPPEGGNPTISQYQNLAFDWPSKALRRLTRWDYKEVSLHLMQAVRRYCRPNEVPNYPIAAATLESQARDDYRLIANHVYAMLGVVVRDREEYVVLREPYGAPQVGQKTHLPSVQFPGRPELVAGSAGVLVLPSDVFEARFRNVSVPVNAPPVT